MSPILIHIVLFMIATLAIVGLGACHADAEDGPALRHFPRRLLMFVAGCAVLSAIMLALEHTVASVH